MEGLKEFIENLQRQGHEIRMEGTTLYVDGKPLPIVSDENADYNPFTSDCPSGVCTR